MQQIRKRWVQMLAGVLVVGGLVGWYKWPFTAAPAGVSLYAPVTQGTFRVVVTSTGELKASQAVQITGPAGAQAVGVFQTKISSMVPEGTVVKAGDVIAELDPAPVATHLNEVSLNLQKAKADFTSAQLDSALTLAQAREDIRTAEYGLEQKKLLKDEAQYEAPTIKRQAELDYEQAARALEQSKANLVIKTQQARAKLSSVGADLARQQNQLQATQALQQSFTIRAPASGMVIYLRDWNGKERGVGSEWNAWNPTVATLPDLTQMEADTYINEVDIRKIAVGQPVRITLDADPGKQLQGVVTQIANVGEQRPNQDSKVFRVKVRVVTTDTTLRPGMTVANAIQVATVPNVLSVPLEAVTTVGGFSYVYKEAGRRVVRQMIEPGLANDEAIVVRRGLTKDDRVLLAVPADTAGIPTVVIPGLKPVTAPAADTGKQAAPDAAVKQALAGLKLPAGAKVSSPSASSDADASSSTVIIQGGP